MPTNNHFESLFDRVSNRYSIDATSMPMSEWIEKNTALRGRPFSFQDYSFQRKIADDMHPNMDVIKISQVGLTEVQIRKILGFLTRNRGVNAIFTLPSEKLYKRISQTRVKPLVEANDVFTPEGTDKTARNLSLIQIGQSFLFLTACTEDDATSTSADAVFNDEVDISPQDMLALFNSRLQNSSFKINQRFSTPTYSGFGIDLGYTNSDQQEYLCRCSACNHHNIPDFTLDFVTIPGLPDHIKNLADIDPGLMDFIDIEGAYVRCEKCQRPLDIGNPSLREWVPRFPGRTHARGYYVRPFVTDRLSISYIVTQLLRYKERDYLRGWYNTVLGKAYTDGNTRLSEEHMNAVFGQMQQVHNKLAPCTIGIDVGLACHITILGPQATFLHKTVPVQDLNAEVTTLLGEYNIVSGAIDRHPYEPTAREIRDLSQGIIMPVEYRGSKKINPVKHLDQEITHFQADRTALLDAVAAAVRRKTITLNGFGSQRSVLMEHFRDSVREENPEEPAHWKKLTGNDHYFHSMGFALFAREIRDVLQLLSNDDVRTLVGIIGVSEKEVGNLTGATSMRSDNLFIPEETRRTWQRV